MASERQLQRQTQIPYGNDNQKGQLQQQKQRKRRFPTGMTTKRATATATDAYASESLWRESAAIQPDIMTIGMPGPGWAAPPAR